MSINNKKIIVGLTGGIAAYKTPYLIRLLTRAGAEVRTIMTSAATKFITPLTIETVSQNLVACEMFPERYVATHHIDLAEWADLFVIAPATANCIGKIASGICDDLLTTVICAAQAPVMIAPAMNSQMYLNPITQNNIEYLKSLDFIFVGPGKGELACETSGIGRMLEPDEIFSEIENFFRKKKVEKSERTSKANLLLKNKKVVVTAGPCREAIDPVRYISNRSSGKMGYALAEAAYEAGADVTLISGPVNLEIESDVNLVKVESTAQMYKAVKKYFKTAHYLIMAAAPADFKAKKAAPLKIKKTLLNRTLELSPTIDILSSLSKVKKTNQRVIGFALETDNAVRNARTKLKAKNLDMIVLNSMEETTPFDSDSNRVIIINKKGQQKALPRMSKKELARELIERISKVK